MAKHEAISRSVLFLGLSDQDKERIAQVAEELEFADGELICRQGEEGDALFLIDEGCVEVVINAEEEDEVVLATLSSEAGEGSDYAGDFFGEMSLIDIEPRSASVRSRGSARVVRISALKFMETFSNDLGAQLTVITNIARVLSRRLRETTQKWCA